MNKSDPAAELRANIRASRQSPGPHVSVEDLMAYRAETSDSESQEKVQGHLVVCEECSELLLDLAQLEDTGGAVDGVSVFETRAAWKRQSERLFPDRRRRRSRLWQRGGWAAAACMALVVGALGFELRERRQAEAWFYAQDLPRVIVEEQGRRSQPARLPVLTLEPGQPGLVILLLDRDLPFTSFRAELLSETGRSLLIRESLSAAEELLLIQVHPGLLPSGKIRVLISGLREDQSELVNEYVLRVVQL